MDSAQLAGHHLLFVDEHTDPDDVVTLVRTRLPHAARAEDGSLKLSRHSTLFGPLRLSADEAERLGVAGSEQFGTVFALRSPVEREPEPPPKWMSSRDKIETAFPAGLPIRDEGRAFILLLDVARRLGLTVRVADDLNAADRPGWASADTVTLTPDPDDAVDLTIYSTFWLTPETLLPVVQQIAPRGQLQTGFAEWTGPVDGVVDDTEGAAGDLGEFERAALHARADQYDAEAMAGDVELEGYGLTVDLPDDVDDADPDNPPSGLIEIQVHVEDEPVPALTGADTGGLDLVAYEVRWLDAGQHRFVGDRPDEFFEARSATRSYVDRLAVGIVEAASGVIVDEFGFLIDRYHL